MPVVTMDELFVTEKYHSGCAGCLTQENLAGNLPRKDNAPPIQDTIERNNKYRDKYTGKLNLACHCQIKVFCKINVQPDKVNRTTIKKQCNRHKVTSLFALTGRVIQEKIGAVVGIFSAMFKN